MADPLNVGKNDIVSTAPFVDDDDVREDEEQHDEDLNPTTDDGSIETPDTSIVDSEADMNGDSEDSQTVDDFAKYDESSDIKEKIRDLLDIIDVIRQGSRERRADQSKKGNDMTRRIKATDESGKITETQSADEILDKVTDTGVAFDAPVEEAKSEAPQEGAVTGDNYDGSDEDPKDVVALPPQPNGDTTAARKRASVRLSKVTTASAMRLADTYIKAGILPESARYAAVERLSRLSRLAAANQQVALELAMRASSKRSSFKKSSKRRTLVNAARGRHSENDYGEFQIDMDSDLARAILKRYGNYYEYDYDDPDMTGDDLERAAADILDTFAADNYSGISSSNLDGYSVLFSGDVDDLEFFYKREIEPITGTSWKEFAYEDQNLITDESDNINFDDPNYGSSNPRHAARRAAVATSARRAAAKKAAHDLAMKRIAAKRAAAKRTSAKNVDAPKATPKKTASTIDPALRKAAIAAAKKKIAAASAKKAATPRIAQRTASTTSDPRMALL